MIGSTILHYKIIEKLGEGGMGVVYKAHDTLLDRKVALKFLPSQMTNDPNERQRFYHEARAAASLMHQNVAVIYEIGEYDGTDEEKKVFLAIEYVEGKTLKRIIEEESVSLSVKRVLDIAIQVCEGLAAAHDKGIVHRDIKSENIMLTPKGQVKITDFGLAKIAGASKLTQTGTTLGTAAYMSPEQATGGEVDRRSDIFSLGIVLYELLTAHLPFRGEYQTALIYSLINEDPQPVARYNDKVSSDLQQIVSKSLAKDKEERYQHVDDMLADLKKERKNIEYAESGYLKSTIPPGGHQKSEVSKSQESAKKPIWKIAVALTVLTLLVIFFYFHNPFKPVQSSEITPGKYVAVMYFDNITDPEDKDHTGGMLTNLLTTSLSEVNGLEVMSRERLLDIQKDMGNADTKTLSPSLAEEIAKKAGVTTMLTGSVLEEKPELAVSTSLIDVQTGRIISSHQLKNFSSDQIFKLVDSLSVLLRNNLEPASSSTRELTSVSEVTTNSTEAYRAYVEGLDLLYNKSYYKESIAAFQKAIELDQNFAMAYYQLYESYLSTGEPMAAKKSFEKAASLTNRVTEREKLEIVSSERARSGDIYGSTKILKQLVERYPHEIDPHWHLALDYLVDFLDADKAVEVLNQGLRTDPSAQILYNWLSLCTATQGNEREAIEAANKLINLAPAEPNGYDCKGIVYDYFEKYDTAKVCYEKAVQLKGDFVSMYKLGYYELLRQNFNEAQRYFNASNLRLPVIDIYKGHFENAEKVLSSLEDEEAGQIYGGTRLMNLFGLYYEGGNFSEMLTIAKHLLVGLHKNPGDKIYGRDYLAWALAKNGDFNAADKLINSIQSDVKDETPLLHFMANYASGLVFFEEGKVEQACDKFTDAFSKMPPNHEPNIFYGISLLKTGMTSDAIKEFRLLLYWPANGEMYFFNTLPGSETEWPIPAVRAHYWLGVAYEKQGRMDDALKEYKKFLEIWKGADFVSAEIKDAKKRVAKLEGLRRG